MHNTIKARLVWIRVKIMENGFYGEWKLGYLEMGRSEV
jgi:hypothetical protein